MPRSPDAAPGRPPQLTPVAVDMEVRVYLNTGECILGRVVDVTNQQLVVGRPGNFGIEHVAIRAVDIERIVSNYHGDTAAAVIGPVAIGLIGFVAAIVAWVVIFHQ